MPEKIFSDRLQKRSHERPSFNDTENACNMSYFTYSNSICKIFQKCVSSDSKISFYGLLTLSYTVSIKCCVACISAAKNEKNFFENTAGKSPVCSKWLRLSVAFVEIAVIFSGAFCIQRPLL